MRASLRIPKWTRTSPFAVAIWAVICAVTVASPAAHATGSIRIEQIVVTSIGTTSAIITWKTDTASDSQVFFGLDDGYGHSSALEERPVKIHSVTLTGLWPGQSYWFAVKSKIGKEAAWLPHDPFTTSPPPESGPYGFYIAPEGPHHVTQGHLLYVQVNMGLVSGTKQRVRIKVSGLPDGAVLHFPDLEDHSVCCTFDRRTATAELYNPERTQFAIATTPATKVGRYVLQISAESGGLVKNFNYELFIDAPQPLASGTVQGFSPIPQLREWRENMKRHGADWCLQETSPGVRCGTGAENCSWYYDGERVYQQIAAYTGDPKWNRCANNSKLFYRDQYVMAASPAGSIQGWRVFPHGLYNDYRLTGDQKSKESVHALALNSAYSSLEGLISARLCRETAYKISVNRLDLELGAGAKQRERLAQSVDYALGDVDQWFISKNADWIQPFMVGLVMESLIEYYENGHSDDTRIPRAIQIAADSLWQTAWDHRKGTFYYNSFYDANGLNSETSNHADLNLLIAPAYAWLWRYTGDPKYLSEGDEIFSQGVRQAAVDFNGKIFSQNYRWSFDYVKWRSPDPH
jgi:hypothetical protein